MTLLPEPVAPAISRCGILDRSAARAWPATSRPRANVSLEAARRSTSSRIRRRATMLKSLFGISRPTTLLPGIGASIRIVRAARAMARSSARASMRLTLISGDGSISYWVTTGPAFQMATRAGMPKLASLATMMAAFRWWSMPLSPMRGAMLSSSASGGRWYSGRGFSAVAIKPPSLDWAGTSRPCRGARMAAPSRTDGTPLSRLSRNGPPSRAVAPAGTGGAKVSDVGPRLGTATGMGEVRSSPKRPASDGPASFAPFSGRSLLAGAASPAVLSGSGAGRNSLAIARASRLPRGAITAGSDMSSASRTPANIKTPRINTVPGVVTRGAMTWARVRPTMPPLGWLSTKPSRPHRDT